MNPTILQSYGTSSGIRRLLWTPASARRAMRRGSWKWGYDGVLLNTAVSDAQHPVMMAAAMRRAVEAGRLAFRSGRMPRRTYAQASSPMEGRVGE